MHRIACCSEQVSEGCPLSALTESQGKKLIALSAKSLHSDAEQLHNNASGWGIIANCTKPNREIALCRGTDFTMQYSGTLKSASKKWQCLVKNTFVWAHLSPSYMPSRTAAYGITPMTLASSPYNCKRISRLFNAKAIMMSAALCIR